MTDETETPKIETSLTAPQVQSLIGGMLEAFAAVPMEEREHFGETCKALLHGAEWVEAAARLRVIAVVAGSMAEQVMGGMVLGHRPSASALLNLLSAIDPSRLTKETLRLLERDCLRLFEGRELIPVGLVEHFDELDQLDDDLLEQFLRENPHLGVKKPAQD